MTSRPKYNQYLTSNRRQVPAGDIVTLMHVKLKLSSTYRFTFLTNLVKCCINLCHNIFSCINGIQGAGVNDISRGLVFEPVVVVKVNLVRFFIVFFMNKYKLTI